MMKSLRAAAVAALVFVHFKDANGARMYVTNEDAGKFNASTHEDGYARLNGEKLAMGVKVYGPGSQEFRKAQDAINTANIKNGKKGLTGASLRQDATVLLARTTAEFVNFEYLDTRVTASTDFETRVRVASAFYDDLEFVGLRDQVETEQNDLGNFSQAASTV